MILSKLIKSIYQGKKNERETHLKPRAHAHFSPKFAQAKKRRRGFKMSDSSNPLSPRSRVCSTPFFPYPARVSLCLSSLSVPRCFRHHGGGAPSSTQARRPLGRLPTAMPLKTTHMMSNRRHQKNRSSLRSTPIRRELTPSPRRSAKAESGEVPQASNAPLRRRHVGARASKAGVFGGSFSVIAWIGLFSG